MSSSTRSKKSHSSRNGQRPHVVPTTERVDRPEKPSNFRTTLTNTPNPLIYGLATLTAIFGITFLIVGSVHTQNCSLEKMLPIWLLVMGLIMAIGGTWLFFVVLRLKKEPFRSVSMIEKFVSISLLLIFFVWFIVGNVWVYKAWGQNPDFGHTWFSNGCDKSVFFLTFVAIITLDAIVGLALIGFCFWGVTKIVVRE